MIGYDEGVLDAQAVAAARSSWTGAVPVRTMPFRRAQADPAAPLLVTFGAVDETAGGAALRNPPPREARAALAAALLRAGVAPLHLMVRVDVGDVIVRGDVRSDQPDAVDAALGAVAALATLAADAVRAALPSGAHLVTATYDVAAGHWVLESAHGFIAAVWRRRFDPIAGWVDVP